MKNMFDLQLFAEDGEAGGAPAATETVASPVEPQQTTPAAPAPAVAESAPAEPEAKSAPAVGIVVDQLTGRRKLVFNDKTEPAAPDNTQLPAETATMPMEQQAQQPPAPEPYTADELFRDIAMGREVDETRVPQELEGHYAAIKQQRVNMAQQQAQAAQAEQRAIQQQKEAPQEEQVTQEQAAQAQLAVYNEIQAMAQQKAAKDLGITPDQLEEAKYSDDKTLQQKVEAYNMAVRMNVDEIKQTIIANRMQQEQQAQAQQMEIKQQLDTIMPKWQEYQKDPHYNEIDNLMGDLYKTMPYAEGVKVAQAIDRIQNKQPAKGDFDTLNDYYLKAREAFYAKQTGVGTTPQPAPAQEKPPIVEKPGSGAPAPATPVNWGSMRTMTPLQRSKFMQSQFRR